MILWFLDDKPFFGFFCEFKFNLSQAYFVQGHYGRRVDPGYPRQLSRRETSGLAAAKQIKHIPTSSAF